MSLYRDMKDAAKNAGGAKGTIKPREVTAREFVAWAQATNVQIQEMDRMKTKHVIGYAQHLRERVERGEIQVRTAQGRMTDMRAMLRAAGRWQIANNERISNKAVGLDGSSRDGTHRAITEEEYRAAYESALDRDRGMAAALQLQRSAGLRDMEIIKGGRADTLARWERELKTGGKIHVIDGTKADRPRWSEIPDHQRFLEAIQEARQVLEDTGRKFLLPSPGKSLKSTTNKYGNEARAIGLRGEISPHSLRYAYTTDLCQKALEEGNSRREALIRVSHSLGHGDQRGRYVAQVYLR